MPEALMRWALPIVVAACTFGCATPQAIKDTRPRAIQQALKVGDTVRVITKDGKEYRMEVTHITERLFWGRTAKQRYKVPYAAVAAITIEERPKTLPQRIAISIGQGFLAVFVAVLIIAAADGFQFAPFD